MKYKRTRTGITRQDLAQDRAFWRDLLARRTSLRGLPAHSAGGYRNRRFAIIRNAAWITLYRAKLPFPQVGVFLRCAGLAGEAFFTLADRARPEIEPLLRAELGPDLAMEWGASHHPGMTDIAAILAAPLPWNDSAAEQHIAWMLRVGAAWWNCFASLAGGPEVNNASPAKRERHAPARPGSASGAVEPRSGSRNAMLGLSYVSKIRRPPSSSMSLTPADFITSACILRPAWWMRLVISCVAFTTSGWSSWPG